MKTFLKIPSLWNNFNEFTNIVKLSGDVTAKKMLREIKNKHFEGELFVGDWKELEKFVYYTLGNCKKVLKCFDYTDSEIDRFSAFFKQQGKSLSIAIFGLLKNNSYNGVQWFGATPFYRTENYVFLTTKTKAKISGHTNVSKIGFSEFELLVDKKIYFVNFNDGEFIDYTEKQNGSVIELNYPEVIRFIKTKYFDYQYIQPISYKNFRYMLMCLRGLPLLKVPMNQGSYMSSIIGSSVLKTEKDVTEYLNKTDRLNVTNTINVKFIQTKYNEFIIERESEKNMINSISETQNIWGNNRSKFPLSPKSTKR